MTKRNLSYTFVCLLAVVGCGGHYSPTKNTDVGSANRFVGSWSGTYAQADPGGPDGASPAPGGTISVTIARDAQANDGVLVTGTASDTANGTGTVTGKIYDGINLPSSSIAMAFGGTTYYFTGKPSLDARGHLVGPLRLAALDVGWDTNFDLAPATQ